MTGDKLLVFGRPSRDGVIRLSLISVNGMTWQEDGEFGPLVALKNREFVIRLNEDGIATLYRREIDK